MYGILINIVQTSQLNWSGRGCRDQESRILSPNECKVMLFPVMKANQLQLIFEWTVSTPQISLMGLTRNNMSCIITNLLSRTKTKQTSMDVILN